VSFVYVAVCVFVCVIACVNVSGVCAVCVSLVCVVLCFAFAMSFKPSPVPSFPMASDFLNLNVP